MRYSLRRTVMVLLFLALTILCGESAGVSLSLLLRRGVRFFDIAGAMILRICPMAGSYWHHFGPRCRCPWPVQASELCWDWWGLLCQCLSQSSCLAACSVQGSHPSHPYYPGSDPGTFVHLSRRLGNAGRDTGPEHIYDSGHGPYGL